MIREIKYKIKFPFGAVFGKDPEIILLSKIYSEIFKCSCIDNGECKNCPKKTKCIYYFLSGENFEKYPSVCISRSFINKRVFKRNEVWNVTFYLIGVSANYSEFITSYIDSEEYFCGCFFQKVIEKNVLINEEKTIDGIITFKNIVLNETDIIESIKYYNEMYKCNFILPEIIKKNSFTDFYDNTKYYINKKTIKINGKLGSVTVNKYSTTLMKIGVGKYAFIGGGISECALE